MLRIRVEGTLDEVYKMVRHLSRYFDVLQESKAYQSRNSKYVRVYVDVDM